MKYGWILGLGVLALSGCSCLTTGGKKADASETNIVSAREIAQAQIFGTTLKAQKAEALKTERAEKVVVEFGSASTDLKSQQRQAAEKIAELLESNPGAVAILEGHADSSGNYDLNRELSEKRAEAVRDLLVEEFEIDPERLSAKGYGDAKPVADNSTEVGRMRNRRVEVTVVEE